ncbi:hypothetical protein [Nocardioides stalactiti]|uniref:hypothetical protein n=1 Tax=Nocardioides stalactiti TaxID=2755356 RepID=UPI00160243BD|nr:hypothetical protein [Nocardioides stalactiti]
MSILPTRFGHTARQHATRAGLPWLVAGAFLLGSATGGAAYAAATIRSADIVDGQVMRADLADGAVIGLKVQDGTIRSNDLARSEWIPVEAAPTYPDKCSRGFTAVFCGYTLDGGPYWTNYGAGWQEARFRKDVTGVVELDGVVRGPVGTAFVLPSGYRPRRSHAFLVSCARATDVSRHAAGRMSVYPDGRVVWERGDECAGVIYISLEGIRFDPS